MGGNERLDEVGHELVSFGVGACFGGDDYGEAAFAVEEVGFGVLAGEDGFDLFAVLYV